MKSSKNGHIDGIFRSSFVKNDRVCRFTLIYFKVENRGFSVRLKHPHAQNLRTCYKKHAEAGKKANTLCFGHFTKSRK